MHIDTEHWPKVDFEVIIPSGATLAVVAAVFLFCIPI